MDTVSNGGFSAILRRRDSFASARRTGTQLRALRLRYPAQSERAICLSVADQGEESFARLCVKQLANFRDAFWHSGVPFSVLSTPYSANGNGIVQGSGPQFASVIPGAPLYEHKAIPGVTQPGTIPWLNPECLCLGCGSEYWSLLWRQQPAELPIRKPRPQCLARSGFLLERFLPDKMVSGHRESKTAGRGPVLQCLQPSEFWPAEHGAGRHSRKVIHANGIWSAYLYDFSANRPSGRRFGRR